MFCMRCGIREDSIRMTKRSERGTELLCRSCVARPAKTISGAFGKCIPWHGNFDAQDNPLNPDGTRFRPGKRICSHRDCVSLDHIIEE